MEYGKPQKLPDGRYFLKINGSRHQVNGVTLQDSLTAKSVNFKVENSNLFTTIDNDLLTQAKASRVEWFGKELSDETIAKAFPESVTDDVISATLATVKGEVVTTAFDIQKNLIELQEVASGSKCDVLLELSGLWFLKKSFGPIWRVVQVRVRSGSQKASFPKEYLFTDDPEEDDDPADYLD
jgi:hypothetical protein